LKTLQGSQNVAHSDESSPVQNDVNLLPVNRASIAEESNTPPRVPYNPVNGIAEIGEVDTAEDSIDGMGAIKFADEEDCGYFGRPYKLSWLGVSESLSLAD
jgi:hypothetical protein